MKMPPSCQELRACTVTLAFGSRRPWHHIFHTSLWSPYLRCLAGELTSRHVVWQASPFRVTKAQRPDPHTACSGAQGSSTGAGGWRQILWVVELGHRVSPVAGK